MNTAEKWSGVVKERGEQLFKGELQIRKADFWLILAAGTLTGLVVGLLLAPFTGGLSISIGSNNGNNSGNGSPVGIGNGKGGAVEDEDVQPACGRHAKKNAKAWRRRK